MYGNQEKFVSCKEGGMRGACEQETNVCAAANREERKTDLTHPCSSCTSCTVPVVTMKPANYTSYCTCVFAVLVSDSSICSSVLYVSEIKGTV